MSIENLDEVKEYFEKNKEDETVKGYMKGFVSLDGVKTFLESNEDGKKYLGSYADSRVTQGIETFKQNNLQKLVDEELSKRNPSSTDPRDLKLQELQNKFEALEKEKARESLMNKGLKMATEKNIPVDLVSFFLGQDEESTVSNLFNLEKSLQAYTQNLRESILAGGSHTPPAGGAPTGAITQADWDKNKNDLDWYAKNKTKIFESKKQGLIK